MVRREDAGTSLLEVLIALAVMGLAMTAILGALGTQVAGTAAHRDQSNAAVVVSSAAEQVKAAPYDITCTATAHAAYLAAARDVALPTDWVDKGWTATDAITVAEPVAYWDGDSFENVCLDTVTTDSAGLLRMQEVQVTATGPDGDSETVTIVKAGPPA